MLIGLTMRLGLDLIITLWRSTCQYGASIRLNWVCMDPHTRDILFSLCDLRKQLKYSSLALHPMDDEQSIWVAIKLCQT